MARGGEVVEREAGLRGHGLQLRFRALAQVDEFLAGVHTALGVDAAQVRVDGVLRDEELAGDAQGARVLGLSKAGNVEILRRRRRPTLLEQFSAECPTCGGTGRVEP